jgi:predicted  nucleic acid-binding Zn-ribbon protein
MSDTTEIEKKSLEAHVELCAERYKHLETKLVSVDEKMDGLSAAIDALKKMLEKSAVKQNDRTIAWGVGIIAFLVSTIGYLITQYVLK